MKFFLFSFSFFLATSIVGQKGYEVGGWLGTGFYYGDLNTGLSIRKPGIAGGLIGKYNFDTRVSLKAGLNYAVVGGDDATSDNIYQYNRNLSFKSRIIDFTTNVELNFLEYYHGSNDQYYTPYLLVGFSFFHFTPQAQLNDTWYDLRPLGTEGQDVGNEYGSINAGFALGFGFKYDLNRDYSLNIEISTHRTFTDYIDDVSTVYADPLTLASRRGPISPQLADRSLIDAIGEPGRQRGNSRDNDVYNLFSIGLVKYFGRLECPKITRDL